MWVLPFILVVSHTGTELVLVLEIQVSSALILVTEALEQVGKFRRWFSSAPIWII